MRSFLQLGKAVLVVALFLGVCATAQAQYDEPSRAGSQVEERSQAFRPAQGPMQEQVSGGKLLIAAYAVLWILIFVYLLRLVRMQQKLAARTQLLEDQIRTTSSV